MKVNEHLVKHEKLFEGIDSIHIIRNDGMIVGKWDNVQSKAAENNLNLTTLMAGAWLASKSVTEYTDSINTDNHKNFKLDFSTSNSGFFIQPLSGKLSKCFISCIYTSCFNPAKLKNTIKRYAQMLDRESFKALTDEKPLGQNGRALFKDITDEEIDNLFKDATVQAL